MKDSQRKEEFIKFLGEHPELRFWQAVYAFTKAEEITVDGKDPFYDT